MAPMLRLWKIGQNMLRKALAALAVVTGGDRLGITIPRPKPLWRQVQWLLVPHYHAGAGASHRVG